MDAWAAQYPRSHWEGCSCGMCQGIYDSHNVTHWCACHGCQTRNLVVNDAWKLANDKVVPNVATVNFCERCESMGKSVAMGAIAYRTDATKGMTELEICPGCVDDFMTWLKSDVMTTREKAYKQPWTDESEQETKGSILSKETLRNLLRELEAGGDTDTE